MKKYQVLIILIILLLINACAKKGRPTGGKKDETAPILVMAKPAYESKNFRGNKIKIYFDEYIVLRDLEKQLIISPPLKNRPIITPQGTASKMITIEFDNEDLSPNTTYTFNFGNAIQDNNEGNKLEGFKYVFATGNTIDSLEYKGELIGALEGKLKRKCSVLLYKLDSTYTDSIVFKKKPNYVAMTTDSLHFNFTNIKEGKYKLYALDEKFSDFIYNPKTDGIAFYEMEINLPQDTILPIPLRIFREHQIFKFKRGREVAKGKIQFAYTGKNSNFDVNLLSEVPQNFKAIKQMEVDKDTLNYWFTPIEKDSLNFVVKNAKYIDTLTVRLRKKKLDSLTVKSNIREVLAPNDTLFIQTNNPIMKVDTTKISFVKDSTTINWKVFKKNYTQLALLFDKKEQSSYKITILPNAFTDIYELSNDSLNFKFSTKKLEAYSSINLTLDNQTKKSLIIEVVDGKNVVQQKFVASDENKVSFKYLPAKKYKLRAIIDDNANNKWDTGDLLQHIQPEKIIYFEKELELRANWTIEETFIIKS